MDIGYPITSKIYDPDAELVMDIRPDIGIQYYHWHGKPLW